MNLKNTVVQGLINTFQMGKTESKKFRYVGFDIEQKGKVIRIDQSAFAADLKVYDLQPERARQTDEDLTAEEKSTLRAISGKIGWLGRGTLCIRIGVDEEFFVLQVTQPYPWDNFNLASCKSILSFIRSF